MLIILSMKMIFSPINNKNITISFIFLAINIGLIIDQYLFLIFHEKTKLSYWDLNSILGMILFIFILSLYTGLILILKKNKIFYKLFKKQKEEVSNYINNLKELSLLFGSSFLMILGTRLLVFLFPENSLVLYGYEIHHIFTGVLILIFTIILVNFTGHIYFNNKLRLLLLFVIGISIGLIIDEFFFLMSGGKTNNDYWNSISVNGAMIYFMFFAILCIVLYFLSQKKYKIYGKNN